MELDGWALRSLINWKINRTAFSMWASRSARFIARILEANLDS